MLEPLGAVLVAEGVERDHDLALVRDLGIAQAQGYLLARPSPASVFTSEGRRARSR
ncbi:MAG: EAL domain-containing protein [Proteobacteria bacterium]|nr:EAL domain-containing protein [Pseudomonadota bacterium]